MTTVKYMNRHNIKYFTLPDIKRVSNSIIITKLQSQNNDRLDL